MTTDISNRYFVSTGRDARTARERLAAQNIRYTERKWQPGVECFDIDPRDVGKLGKVFVPPWTKEI
jgi:hypothetical protein